MPSPAQSGDTVICSSGDPETKGIGDNKQSNVTVTIYGSAIVRNDFAPPFNNFAIALVSDNTIENNGIIMGDGGIFVGGFNNLIENTAAGAIYATKTGVAISNTTMLLNSGVIEAGFEGVVLSEGAVLSNEGSIYVEGASARGVAADTGSTFENDGDIIAVAKGTSTADGIQLNAGNKVVNADLISAKALDANGLANGIWMRGNDNDIANSGVIEAKAGGLAVGINADDGVRNKISNTGEINAVSDSEAIGVRSRHFIWLDNDGTIEATGVTEATGAILGQGSELKNSGTITANAKGSSVGVSISGTQGDVLFLDNSGTISADTAITMHLIEGVSVMATANIDNSGTINGDILLFERPDKLFNLPAGEINGDIVMGEGRDVVVNTGTIAGKVSLGAGDDFYFTDTGSIGGNDGTVDPGTGWDSIGIYASGTGSGLLKLSGGFESAGVYADEGAVFTIAPGSGDAKGMVVSLLGTGTVINDAALAATAGDAVVTLPEHSPEYWNYGLEFRNQNSIKGGSYGIEAGDHNVVINAQGAAISSLNYGVHADEDNDILNRGTITSETGGIFIGFTNGEDLNGDGYAGVTNLGSIEAPVGITTQTGVIVGGINNNLITNGASGQITAYTGIQANSNYNRIENLGNIDAEAFGIRVAGAPGNLIINAAGATIRSGDDGIHAYGDATRISNSGLIQGGEFGQGDGGGPNSAEAHGIRLIGDAGTIQNPDGRIYSGTGHGILVTGNGNHIVNGATGIIDSTGNDTKNVGVDGIFIFGTLNVVTNEGGTISGARNGVTLAGSGNKLVNEGIVEGFTAVSAGTGNHEIVNSGVIKGTAAAIDADLNLNLKNSGVIDGDVLLGFAGNSIELAKGSQIKGDIVGGNGTDTIKSTGDGSVNGKITGIETLTVEDGTLVLGLEDVSSVQTTTVNGGTLRLEGTLTTNATVTEDGALSGGGTVQGSLTNEGMVTPGTSIGTLSINGTYSQESTGQLFVELGAAGADKLAVTGTATLDGALNTGLLGTNLNALEGKSYTVLTAGGISGGFDTKGVVQQGFWTLDVQQTGNAVVVTVTDVDVTIGATAPVTGALAGAIGNAAPATEPQGGGIVVEGVENTLPIIDQESTALDYDSLGDWESAAASYGGGFDGLGARTPAGAMPKTGTAAFEGTTQGALTETASGAPEAFVVEGNVLLTANFASGLVNADFTEMEKIDAAGVASAWVDFRARMSIADGTSEFAGTAGTDDGVWNGEAKGGFFGDEGGMPGHAAGLWSISSPLGRALGGFTAKRQ